MNKKLLEILACPECKAPLDYFPKSEQLVCRAERLVFAINEGIPVLLLDEAEAVSSESLDAMDAARKCGDAGSDD